MGINLGVGKGPDIYMDMDTITDETVRGSAVEAVTHLAYLHPSNHMVTRRAKTNSLFIQNSAKHMNDCSAVDYIQ